MIELNLPAKMLHFVIEAVEFRIHTYEQQMASHNLTEDEFSDIANDTQLLRSTKQYLDEKNREYLEKP
jgi:hypothetical protein